MSGKWKRLKSSKYMPLRTDTLPYETPITFSNRYFHKFLVENDVKCEGGKLSWKKGCAATDAIMKVLFPAIQCDGKSYKPMLKAFSYPIKHKNQEFRYLAVPHPAAQFAVANFYQQHKDDVLYYASISPYSIRKPVRISKYYHKEDSLHFLRVTNESTTIEQADNDYRTVRSFFAYRQYSNVHKFYESYTHHRCEQKYRNLCKLDITKCFDSIYTHSLPWAILGKQAVKNDLGKSNGTFAGHFDRLMQQTNELETNGIIIGPEFSRVFAELILQRIDVELERRLAISEKRVFQHKSNYEMFRYVDDFFIFYDDEKDLSLIVSTLQHILKEYKLHLNPGKQEIYSKPIITSMSQAKLQVSDLLNRIFGTVGSKPQNIVSSEYAITEFKSIIKRCNVEYKDMLNYSLAAIEQRCEVLLEEHLANGQPKESSKTETCENKPKKSFNEIVKDIDPERRACVSKTLFNLIEFSFFIYSVAPRTNTTIRLCRIVRLILAFLKKTRESHYQKDRIFKLIFDNATLVLRKEKRERETQVETLFLLILLHELGRRYALAEERLAEYFDIPKVEGVERQYDFLPKDGKGRSGDRLNYWSITVLLFYIGKKKKYDRIRDAVQHLVKHLLTSEELEHRKRSAELTLLFFDVMSCPYIDETVKIEILKSYEICDCKVQQKLVLASGRQKFTRLHFTNWNNFDFGKELDAKRSAQVY